MKSELSRTHAATAPNRSSLLKGISCFFLLSLVIFSVHSIQGQTHQTIPQAEEELAGLFDSITASPSDDERVRSGDRFNTMLREVLMMPGAFRYSFSLLPKLSKLDSPDGVMRILTWNIPLHSGMNRFYGMILYYPHGSDSLVIVDLVDEGHELSVPEEDLLSPRQWYGAIYYKLIPSQTAFGEPFYTLLGWRGENMLLTIRLIDVLSITLNGEFRFGKQVFCDYLDSRPFRILFRHNANVTMSLRYEEQLAVTSKQWNARKKAFIYTYEKSWMIVCDRLVPPNPQLEGQYEYYTPAGDVMDGFTFKEGCWNFIQEIDARNPEKK